MANKTCRRCDQDKPLTEFHNSSGTGDKKQVYCKICNIKIKARWIRKRKNFIIGYKLARGCGVCGFAEHPSALHFHHRDPDQKEFNIGRGHHYTFKRLWKEMQKCDVICANHHAMLTHDYP